MSSTRFMASDQPGRRSAGRLRSLFAEDLGGPGAGGIDDERRPHVEDVAGQPIARPDPGNCGPAAQNGQNVRIIDGCGFTSHHRLDEGDREPFRAVQLVVVPDGASGDPAGVDERVELETLGAGNHAAGGQPPRRVYPLVAITCEQIVAGQEGAHQRARMPPARRNDEWQHANEVRRDAGNLAALAHELTDARERALLQLPDAAVQGLEAVERSAGREIIALDEADGHAASRELVSDGQPVDAAAGDDRVEGRGRQALQVPLHQMTDLTSLLVRGTSSPGPPYAVARGGPVPRSAPAARSLRSLASLVRRTSCA